jgi:hypothetical protein
MSNDLRNLSMGSKAVLTNKYVIAVDQDPLGKMGLLVNQVSLTITKTLGKEKFLVRQHWNLC